MTKKYLINQNEADVLASLVDAKNSDKQLGFDLKQTRPHSNFPFRFKLKETIGATTANKALAQIFFFGDSTANIYSTDYVVDDSSSFSSASSGDYGICIASSEYHISYMPSESSTLNSACLGLQGAVSKIVGSSAFVPELTSKTDPAGLTYDETTGGINANDTGFYLAGFSLTATGSTDSTLYGQIPVVGDDFNFALSKGNIEAVRMCPSDLEVQLSASGVVKLDSTDVLKVFNNSTFYVIVKNMSFWVMEL